MANCLSADTRTRKFLTILSFTFSFLFQLVEDSMVKLDRICREANIILIFARSYGLMGLVRISVKVILMLLSCYFRTDPTLKSSTDRELWSGAVTTVSPLSWISSLDRFYCEELTCRETTVK